MRKQPVILSPWLLPLLSVLAATLPACDSASTVERGFGSRQLLPIRDSELVLTGGWDGAFSFTAGGDFWLLDLDTGAAQNLGATPPQIPPPMDPNPTRYRCATASDMGVFRVTVTDLQSGQQTVIDRVSGGDYCPDGDDPTIFVWREDDIGNLTLWTGPYDQLTAAPVDLIVRRIAAAVRVQGTARADWVFAARPSQPFRIGVFAIELQNFAVTEIISPALGTAAWATGATADSSPLESVSLSEQSGFPDAGDGRYAYQRIMSDGSTVTFVGPYTTGPSELALFRAPAGAHVPMVFVSGSLSGSYALRRPRPTWQVADFAGPASAVIAWSDQRQQVTTCPLPATTTPLTGQSDPDEDWVALFASQLDADASRPARGPLLLMRPGECRTLAASDVTAFGFSPDGTATAWLVQPTSGNATLWTAGRDGGAPRMVGSGAVAGPPNHPRFVGPAELQLELGGDLAWIDVHDDPVRMHYIAERVFGRPLNLGDWLVTGYGRSSQDANGTLGLVQRHTGVKRLISREVASFTPAHLSAFARGQLVLNVSDPVEIVYVVRGRNPSPQDGIWVATITKDDRN